MKTPFVQTQHGFCTQHSLSNMFNDDFFINNYCTPDYKGCDDHHEIEMLSKFDPDFSIASVLSIRHNYNIELPHDLIYKVLRQPDKSSPDLDEEDFDLIPYLLDVRIIPTHEFWHSVVVFNKNGELYFSDPRRRYMIKIDENLFDQFVDCWSIKRPYLKSTDRFMRISSKRIGLEFF